MKKIIFCCVFALAFCFLSVNLVQAQDFKPYVSVSAYSNEGEPYLEFLFMFKGNSLVYKQNDNGYFVAHISVKAEIFLGDDLFKTQKYTFTGDEFRDNNSDNKPDILELKEVSLPNNKYLVKITMQDVNSQKEPYQYTTNVDVNFPGNRLAISSLNLYSSFNQTPGSNKLEKYGYYFVPLYNHELPATVSNLPYLYEVYNSDVVYGSGKNVFINTLIENFENNMLALPFLQKIVTFQAKPAIVCFDEMNVSQLPTGKYYLVVRVMDNNNSIIKEEKQLFTNENPSIKFNIENYDSGEGSSSFAGKIPQEKLKEYILMLAPVSTQFESDFFKNNLDRCSLTQLQNYFYSFWYLRNNTNPEQAWKDYFEKK
jgi:hypothetical protein